jgi:D-serine deaminase-like pyridoxal phosphate-dependent protein
MNASNQDQTNGHRQARREEANIAFADFQFYDPHPSAQAGEVLEPGMLIRATSSVEYMTAVAESSAIAYLYREGDDMPVLNGTAQATASIVDPNLAIDSGVAEGTVTVQYEWEQLSIHQAGTYVYRVIISGKAEDGEVIGLGVYDSVRIVVLG